MAVNLTRDDGLVDPCHRMAEKLLHLVLNYASTAMRIPHRSLIAIGSRPSLHWENPKKIRDFGIASVFYLQ